jgi:hypothetical protein
MAKDAKDHDSVMSSACQQWFRIDVDEANRADRIEPEIDQAAVKSNKAGTSLVHRQPPVRNYQTLAIVHLNNERYERLPMDQLDDFFFHLVACHGHLLFGALLRNIISGFRLRRGIQAP